MESHEEKLLAMVQESKMNQAREIMKQKEKELKAQQPQPSGLSYFASFFTAVASSVTGRAAAPTAPTPTPSSSTPTSSIGNTGNTGNTGSGGYGMNGYEMNGSGNSGMSLGRGMKLGMGKKESLSVRVFLINHHFYYSLSYDDYSYD